MSGDVGRRLGCSGYAGVHSADVPQLSRPLESKVTKKSLRRLHHYLFCNDTRTIGGSSPTTSAQIETNTKETATIHKHTMPKRHADSTQDEKPRKRRQLSAGELLVEAVRNGNIVNTTDVREFLGQIPHTAVHEACRRNDDECLTLLLPYVETTQKGFETLLSECVHTDHVACTEVLLQHWKSVCNNVAFVPHQWTDPAVCRVLIDAGADLHTKDEDGCLPLHSACDSGALDVVKMLVEAGAEVRAKSDDGETSFTMAAAHGHTETVCYLLGLPDVDVNHGNFNALQCAAMNGHTEVVRVLIDAGADIDIKDNYDGCSPLHYACESESLESVKMLVRAGAGVRATNHRGETCLVRAVHAAHYGDTEILRYLVCLPEVDVNYRQGGNCTALHYAVDEKPRTDVIQVLIDAGADIDAKNSEGRSPLHSACASGELDVVKMLVEAGAGVRATNDRGEPCLFLAARCGHTETVRYLVGLPEVDVNRRYAGNYTALQCALENEETDVVQVLIDAGADIVTNNNALHYACEEGSLDIVKMLVRAGAGVRATNDEGWTCLITAARYGHTETVRYLVGLPEVELNHRDTAKNYTALHYAVEQKHTDVAQVLTDALLLQFEAANSRIAALEVVGCPS